MAIVFDIETNGMLDETDTIHSLVILDTEKREMWSCHNQGEEAYESPNGALYLPINKGIELLERVGEKELCVGHNILKFDIPAIKKLFKDFGLPIDNIRDTLVMSRLIYPEIKAQLDFKLLKKGIKGGPWMGRHSLGAWGVRLNKPKDDYAERMKAEGLDPWAKWNPMMQRYCEQDVLTNAALWRFLDSKNPSPLSVWIEHHFQEVIFHQERHGFPFNEREAEKLYAEWSGLRADLEQKLKDMYPDWYAPDGADLFVPKKDNKRYGYQCDCPMTKIKLVEFNPTSREHIARVLAKYRGWEPTEFTDAGNPSVSEKVLKALWKQNGWEECKLMMDCLTINKRLGQLAEGKQAWLKVVGDDGRIHGGVITNGAVTGRCTHKHPNVAQVPKVKKPYGKECRGLFTVDPGYVLVGCDASGLELRVLAHYMARYDGGEYASVVLEGDIHTVNMEAAGLDDRDQAKTFIYAFLYGSGPLNLGSLVRPLATEEAQRRIGQKMINRFLKKTPALKRLREDVKSSIEKRGRGKGGEKYLKGIDGRKLHIRAMHAALNTLFQSAGAVAMKLATIILYHNLLAEGYEWGKDFAFVAHIHDEYQLMVRKEIAERVGEQAVEAIRKAGEQLNFKIPLDGEYKIGANWAETH